VPRQALCAARFTHAVQAPPLKARADHGAIIRTGAERSTRLKRDDFSSDRHHALAHCSSMILSENRYTLIRIML